MSRVARERGQRLASSTPDRRLWAAQAWLPDGWAEHVLLQTGTDGCWERVETGVHEPPRDAHRLDGAVLPGLVDAHSHAFQRAFAGLAERRAPGAGRDDFWSWRERMYAVAERIAPDTLRAIAAQLDVELLKGGYTHVCEFHYLQHAADGRPYADDPLALAWALVDAAGDAGVGLTVLPVLYERAGFDGAPLARRQRRFALDADATWAAHGRLAGARRPHVHAGLAIHSLRAAAPASIERLLQHAGGYDGPIHVHVAEQAREVEECVAALGARPVAWLAARRSAPLDARWQLVHATHVTRAEIDAVAGARAGVVLCPSTEANLGDGCTDLRGWLDANRGATALSIGSDSHVTRAWTEELRLLEYGQRLVHRERNVAAAVEGDLAAPAERLWQRALAGGAAAAFGPGARWGLAAGARADLLVADPREPALLGVPKDRALDALVFSSPSAPWRDVMVAGRWVVRDRVHDREVAIAARFEAAMQAVWR